MLNGFDRPVVRTDNEQGGSYYLSAVLIQLIEFVVANVGCDYSFSISD
ncbi:hypothetical protein I3271_05215 [Photobacterium leiognathi]|nr:hypothetical protein [Photobacterium leiognathi]MCG3884080.1 hypothetical protein [Photobacterium leiognathi]